MRGFVINAVLVLWRRILSRCAPIAESARGGRLAAGHCWAGHIGQF
jgi:hypothetical protein